jgi:hypothetical protein
MTYTNALALAVLAVLAAATVAAWTLHRIGVRPIASLRACHRRASEARLRDVLRRNGGDTWRAQDGSELWMRGVHR